MKIRESSESKTFNSTPYYFRVSLVVQIVKNLPAMWEAWVRFLGWEDPLEKGQLTNSLFLPRGFHGQRSLVGYSQWAHKESDVTEQLTLCAYYCTLKNNN